MLFVNALPEHYCFHCFYYALMQIWEIVYSKDGSVKEVSKVMQLKGHKVTIIIFFALLHQFGIGLIRST